MTRLLAVSYAANRRFSPRGTRTRAVVEAAEDAGWQVALVAGPADAAGGTSTAPGLVGRARRLVGSLHRLVLIDKHEPWAWARFARFRADADLGYLVAQPFSVVARAAAALAAQGVPYVVDAGDPWVLTAGEWTVSRHLRGLAMRRAQRHERAMWEHAVGAVVTSQPQATALLTHFPHLSVLVRANGYEPAREQGVEPIPSMPGVLRLAHFGNVYDVRVDVGPLLERLVASKRWERIAFDQYGNVWDPEARRSLDVPGIEYRELPMRSPEDLPALAAGYDAAIVICNRSGIQIPSKVFQYMTLPVPRVAIVHDPAADQSAALVSGRPGWLVVAAKTADVSRRLDDHVRRNWTPADLAPPPEDAWPAVAAEIVGFLHACLGA